MFHAEVPEFIHKFFENKQYREKQKLKWKGIPLLRRQTEQYRKGIWIEGKRGMDREELREEKGGQQLRNDGRRKEDGAEH